MMNGFLKDLRFGIRQLAAKPGFAVAAILTLALGIGANTAVFSVLSGYLLKPLPYPAGQRLATIDINFPVSGASHFGVSVPMYKLIREDMHAFSSTAISHRNNFTFSVGGAATRVSGIAATASLFQVLGVEPALGHAFEASASEPGKGKVAVISDRLWRNSFGANPKAVGQTIRLDGKLVRIVGVMPRGFVFPERDVDIWVPRPIAPGDRAATHMFDLGDTFIGRLKPGIRLGALRPQIKSLLAHIRNVSSAKDWQDMMNAGFEMVPRSYRDELLGDRTSNILLLQGAVLLVLLMTCVNVANLLLSRILGRSHEIAMRSALGASRAALARQLLVESVCLAVPGGLVGVVLGWLGLHFFAQPMLSGSGSVFDMTLDWRVGLAALVVVGLTVALVSVLPIRHLAKIDLQSLLQAGGRSAGGGIGARRVRSALVAIELTLATVLLAASGLLLHSFINLEAVNPGFRQNDILIGGLLVPDNDHPGDAALGVYYRDLLQRVRTLPGVRSAGIGLWLPMGRGLNIQTFDIRGRKRPPGSTSPVAAYDVVDGGYFSVLGLPILRGRGFDSRDTAKSLPVVIIDTHLAKQYFGGADPLGRQLKLSGKWHTIIGVVPAVKLQRLNERTHATVYLDISQVPPQVPARDVRLAIQTSIPPNLLIQPLRKAVTATDPSVALYGTETMHERLADSLRDRQTTMALLLAFGCIALALAVVGVYGVLSYAVGQRVTECGVRLALGALPGDLLWLVIKDGLKLLGVGLIVGLGLAVTSGYVLSSRLFGVVPFDPLTLIGTIAVLSGITLAASYLPARRAAKLDPAVAIMEQ